jgi:hypothetical protein
MLDKVGEYLQSGVGLVWVSFDGEDVVPGFSVELADLLG